MRQMVALRPVLRPAPAAGRRAGFGTRLTMVGSVAPELAQAVVAAFRGRR
jgi:hypothetical protein